MPDPEMGVSLLDASMLEGQRLRAALMDAGVTMDLRAGLGALWLAASILSHPDCPAPTCKEDWRDLFDLLLRAYGRAHEAVDV